MPQHWTCPFCNRPTTLNDQDTTVGDSYLLEGTKFGVVGLAWSSIRCPNPDCKEVALYVRFTGRNSLYGGTVPGDTIESWTLRPEANARPLPHYIPEPIQEDYYEACLIVEKSPKASATLSRRCLQGMIRDFWGISERTLFQEIEALEQHVEPSTWEAIKAVKDVGNIGAHMEANINHIVPVEPEEAQLLIGMIEQLIGDWYVQRFEREQRTKNIVDLAEEKKALKRVSQEPDADVT